MSDSGLSHSISDIELSKIEESAADFARQSGNILFKYFGLPVIPSSELDVRFKDSANSDPVTLADTEVQQYLSQEILGLYPNHSVVGEEDEEYQETLSDTVWVIDPLDGTRNFLNGLPMFASSIGVLHRGEFLVGAVFVPWPGKNQGIVVHASKNHGAKIDGIHFKMPEKETHKPSGVMTLPGSFSTSFKFEGGFARESGELRMAGSIAFELVMVALGITEYAVIGGSHLWDIAGCIPIINEAGGGIRKHSKKPFRSRLITGSQYWEDFDSLGTLSGSDSYSTSEFRKYTPQILAAHANVIDNVSLNITPRNVGFKGAAGSIFRK